MATLTSFDALQEPTAPDDREENVVSRFFQRVKSTLSSTSSTTPSSGSIGPSAPGQTPRSSVNDSHVLGSGRPRQSSISEVMTGGSIDSNGLHPRVSLPSSVSNSDQHNLRIHESAASSGSSISSLGLPPLDHTHAGPSWTTGASDKRGVKEGGHSIGNDHHGNSNSNTQPRSTSHHSLATSDPGFVGGERPPVSNQLYSDASGGARRASSIFRLSVVDLGTPQDESSSSLSTLAPPVVTRSSAERKESTQNERRDSLATRSNASGETETTWQDSEENSMARDLTLGVRGSSYDSDGRSIRSFNSGHHKSNSLTKVMKRFRGDGVNRDFWMADENAKECFGCSLPFSVFRRRHHCRICGHIFCYKCSSNNIPGAKLGRDGNQRVCSYCLEGMEEDEELENGAIEHPAVPTWQNASPSAIHSHYSQQPSISPSVNSAHQDVTPLDGFRKLLNAGSLFLARSRSNTAAGDQVMDGGSVPFRRSLVLEDGSMHDSVLDPEIAPFMGDEDEDDQLDLWTPNPPHSMGFLSANSYDRDWDSEEEAVEQIVKDKSHLRNSRTDDPRGMFSKDRSPVNRRISMNGTRPSRNLSLSLKSRSLLRSEVVESLRSPMDARPSSPYLGASSQSLLHTGRHSRAASMVTNAPELNSASLQHMRRLLRQLLIRFEINDKDGWDDVIIKLVLKVSTSIQTLGVMDVMELVKIKKIPGGTAQDTLYINGVVCTKNLAHKQMSRSILNPKILILRFALEYQRVENHFTSLDPILNQEKEYLQNLVTRIAALGPRLLIVEKTVSRLALNLLLDHKIAVAYNVKPVVTEAIAHSTGAEIILSFDKLVKEPRLGTCSLFEIKTFVHNLIPNKRKSYMFFQDCPGNLFCSLVLRGGSLEMLNRIKKVVRLMVWVSYNLKLETSLMNDQFAMITAVQESTLAQEQDVKMSKDPDISQLQEMLKPYKHTILSASPFVVFEPPFLLSRLIEDAVELKKFEQPSTLSTLKDIGNSKILFTSAYSNAIVSKSSTGRSQDSGFIEGSYIDISNDYQSKSQAWGEFLSSNIPPSLIDPFNYQNLVFLYANVCTSTKTTCGTPHIRLIQYYYYETDLTLASYLVKTCFKSHFQCESCGRPLLDHQQIYAHGAAKVTVTLEPWESMTESKKDSIMMWSKCRICRVETPQVYMSDDTKSYSFGKFLELIFYQSNLACRASVCPHDINRDHVRYFGVDTQLVKIERSTISLYDINFPPMLVRCKPEYAARTKNQDLDLVRTLITRYWDSVMERIKNCIFDVVQPSKIEAAKQELLEMLRNVVLEKKGILQLLQQTYLNSAPTDTLALNMVRIKLYDRAVAWNKIFSDFARDYFNPDRDFRRSTAHHIRLLFDEKEFPMASDRAHHAVLMNDLPITLDSSNDIETSYEESLNFAPSDLPYLGSSPTLKVAKPKIEQGDVAALESAIETATSQIVFPFMEPKVTRRLSMNLMQEFRPKIAPTQPLDSSPTSSDESQDPKPRIKSSIAHSMIPRLPSSARHTSRVTSRLSTVTMPSFDPMSLLQQERKEGQESLLSSKPSSGIITSVSIHTGAPASPQSSKTTADRFIIPLDRTPTNERPSSAASSSSGKNPYFFTKPRPRRPTETPSSSSSLATSPVLTDKQMAPTNTLTSTTLSARRSTYLAKAHGGGIPNTSSNNVQSTVVTNAEPGRNTAGNRSRSMTQPIPGPSGGARTRYLNAISNRHHPRPLESKQPSIEVFSSVKEAAKEESDDEDEYQSGSEGDEPFHPSRGYKFSLVQTDAMDEALGSEDPKAMEAAVNSRTTNDNYSTSVMDDNTQIEPIMMFLGEDDPLPLDKPQDQHFAGTAGNGASSSGSGVGGSSAASNNGNHSTTVGSPPSKSSTMNMTVSGTLSAALAAAKLPQLSEVAEGVERGGSIMKTLSTFWQDRNYLNFTPLDFPMQPFEHVFSYSQIIIREDEPSSIIALTLSSPSYVEKLGELFRGESLASINATATSNSGTATPAEETVGGSYDSGNSNTGTTPLEGIYDDIPVYDDSMLLEPGTHMKIPFVDGSTSLYCKVFYMEQFHALRKAAGCEYSYIQSLARCMKWDANGGKSGSSFLKTRDDRFIMKQLSKIELEAFIKFAPHYFQYMQKAYYHKRPTVLAKIFGFYRVGYKHGALGRSMNMDVLIMENLFYDRRNVQVYDLKGSRRNRYVQPTGREGEVLLDENFIHFMAECPFYIREHAKLQLTESLANDSQFLQRFNIMDYSLLVAVADDRKELVVGIVDFIRPFTWDKKLESWVKDAVGSKEPTIVSPAQYRKRFRTAMGRHLDMVPDRWFDANSRFSGSIVHRSIGRSYHYDQYSQAQYLDEQGYSEQEQWTRHGSSIRDSSSLSQSETHDGKQTPHLQGSLRGDGVYSLGPQRPHHRDHHHGHERHEGHRHHYSHHHHHHHHGHHHSQQQQHQHHGSRSHQANSRPVSGLIMSRTSGGGPSAD